MSLMDAQGSSQVHQASGMVSVQAQCSIAEALMLLRARAMTTHRSVDEIAEAVIDGFVRFDD